MKKLIDMKHRRRLRQGVLSAQWLVIENKVRVLEGCRPDDLPLAALLADAEPVVLKGLVRDWPLVRAGPASRMTRRWSYLRSFYNGRTVGTYFGGPDIGGRLFYNDERHRPELRRASRARWTVLRDIRSHRDDARPPPFYIGSTTIDACLPGLRKDNDVAFRAPRRRSARKHLDRQPHAASSAITTRRTISRAALSAVAASRCFRWSRS